MGSLSIIPLGPIKHESLDFLRTELAKRFNLEVKVLEGEAVPEDAYSLKREQYHSTRILERLPKFKKKEERVLAVIDVDLYVPGLNFVFGEADVNEGVCIISLTRLRQEYYGLPRDERLFLERALKEAVHEIGHTFGIGHCQNSGCIMHFSNSLEDTDIKGPDFCIKCKGILNHRDTEARRKP